MSTILNALQKQSENQLVNTIHRQESDRSWKIALSIALLVIIMLLGSLLFLLYQPVVEVNEVAAVNKLLIESERMVDNKVIINPIKTIVFQTRPLPSSEDTAFFVAPNTTKKVPQSKIEALDNDVNPLRSDLVDTKAEVKDQSQSEIDYSNVSVLLQDRFKQALLMSKDGGKAFIENEDSDGYDLHQMSSNFQDEVPTIKYQYHVYSSNAKDRWIRINDEDLVEGQFDSSGEIEVVEIQANKTIFRLGKQSFSLQSLTNWQPLQG